MRLVHLALYSAGALTLLACEESQRRAPAPGGVPVAAPSSQPAMDPAAAQPGAPASAPAGGSVAGTIKLGKAFGADTVRPNDVLFVMARQPAEGGARGALVAVQRHSPPTLPFAFELGPQDMMMPGTPFEGPFVVRARLDRDGDPMTTTEDDLVAESAGAVAVGTRGLELVLEKAPPPPPGAPPPVLPPGAPNPHGPGAAPAGGPNPHAPGGAMPIAPPAPAPH